MSERYIILSEARGNIQDQINERAAHGYTLLQCWSTGLYTFASMELTVERTTPPTGLTRREREVLDALLAGSDTHDIAHVLSISLATVRNHLKSVFRKADVHSQRELVQKYLAVQG